MKQKLFKQILWIIAMIVPLVAAILFDQSWLWMYVGLGLYRFFNKEE